MRFQYGLCRLLIVTTTFALFLGLAIWIVGDGMSIASTEGVSDVLSHHLRSRQFMWFGAGRAPLLLAVAVGAMCAMLWQERRSPVFLLLFLGLYFFSMGAPTLYAYYSMRFLAVMSYLSLLSVVEVLVRRLGRRLLGAAVLSCVYCLGLFFVLQCQLALFR